MLLVGILISMSSMNIWVLLPLANHISLIHLMLLLMTQASMQIHDTRQPNTLCGYILFVQCSFFRFCPTIFGATFANLLQVFISWVNTVSHQHNSDVLMIIWQNENTALNGYIINGMSITFTSYVPVST